MSRAEGRPLKVEGAQAAAHVQPLLEALAARRAAIDERVVRALGRGVGFRSSDEKVYRLLAALAERHVEAALASINHKSVAAISEIHKKIELAQKDMKTTPKKLHNLLRALMGRRVLGLQEALAELREHSGLTAKVGQVPRQP